MRSYAEIVVSITHFQGTAADNPEELETRQIVWPPRHGAFSEQRDRWGIKEVSTLGKQYSVSLKRKIYFQKGAE